MCTRTPGRPTDASASLFHMGEAYFLLPRPRVHSIRTNSCKHKNTSGFTVKTCFRHLHGQRAVHTHNAATVILRVCVCGKCAPVVSRNECEPRTQEARSARHYLVCTAAAAAWHGLAAGRHARMGYATRNVVVAVILLLLAAKLPPRCKCDITRGGGVWNRHHAIHIESVFVWRVESHRLCTVFALICK